MQIGGKRNRCEWEAKQLGGQDPARWPARIDLSSPKLTSLPRNSLFKPQTGHGSTFFYSAQTFCIAWLWRTSMRPPDSSSVRILADSFPSSAWDVPPLPILSKHASRAATFILPSVPIVVRECRASPTTLRRLTFSPFPSPRLSQHRPTLLIEAVDPSLAFALAVTGAAFSARGSSFSDRMTKTKREFGASHLKDETLGEEQAFGILQSLVLYNIIGSFHNNLERESSIPHQGSIRS